MDARPLTYPELFDRAKRQVNAAQEFFYEQRWEEVEKASKALADTSAQVKKLSAEAVPEKHRATYQEAAARLAKASDLLSEAGKAKSNVKTTEAFQELLLTVRDLRPE